MSRLDLTIHAPRDIFLEDAFVRHPNRFNHPRPQPPELPAEAGINMAKLASGEETIAKIAV